MNDRGGKCRRNSGGTVATESYHFLLEVQGHNLTYKKQFMKNVNFQAVKFHRIIFFMEKKQRISSLLNFV